MGPNTDHIQTTHIGSMIRPPEALELLAVKEAGEPYDAAPDCGFCTFVGLGSVAEDIMWLKREALVQGARLASDRLF